MNCHYAIYNHRWNRHFSLIKYKTNKNLSFLDIAMFHEWKNYFYYKVIRIFSKQNIHPLCFFLGLDCSFSVNISKMAGSEDSESLLRVHSKDLHEHIAQEVGECLESGLYTDLMIRCNNGQTLHGHKLVLSAVSPYLKWVRIFRI